MKAFLVSVGVLLFGASPSLAAECKYKQAYANADIACNGSNAGGCMFNRFKALTGYEASWGDYTSCVAWELEKSFQ